MTVEICGLKLEVNFVYRVIGPRKGCGLGLVKGSG